MTTTGSTVLDVRAEPLHERAHGRDDDRGQMLAAGRAAAR